MSGVSCSQVAFNASRVVTGNRRRPSSAARAAGAKVATRSAQIPARSLGPPRPVTRRAPRPVGYKEATIGDDVHDWRIKQMSEIAHKYYADMWSKGDKAVADEILDDNVKLNDELWGSHPFVGPKALFAQVTAFRKMYPDLIMEIDDIGVYGTQDLAIRWSARATNLGGPHPTHHYTHFSGVSSFHFTDDRKRVLDVVTYRQPTSEEMTNKCEISWRRQPSTNEIQLVPLHVSTANYNYTPNLKK